MFLKVDHSCTLGNSYKIHCLHVKLFVNYHKKTYIECLIATFKAVTFAAILASRCTLHNRGEENN